MRWWVLREGGFREREPKLEIEESEGAEKTHKHPATEPSLVKVSLRLWHTQANYSPNGREHTSIGGITACLRHDSLESRVPARCFGIPMSFSDYDCPPFRGSIGSHRGCFLKNEGVVGRGGEKMKGGVLWGKYGDRVRGTACSPGEAHGSATGGMGVGGGRGCPDPAMPGGTAWPAAPGMALQPLL